MHELRSVQIWILEVLPRDVHKAYGEDIGHRPIEEAESLGTAAASPPRVFL